MPERRLPSNHVAVALPSTRRLGDVALTALVWTAAGVVTAACGWMLADVAWRGASRLSLSFLLTAPRSAGRSGGIGPIMVSTGLILSVCLAVSVPLGVGTAMLLGETTAASPRFRRWVRRSLDVLAGVPSIVFGLFGNALFCVYLGLGFSILSGGLTLACMVLPILVRSTEAGLRAVPDEHRHAAAALGMSRRRTLVHVLLPAATPGLIVGLVLGIGRALAETAALIFTSGYADRLPRALGDSGRTLSVHIYDLAMNVAGGEPNAFATAIVLVGLLLAINHAASWISNRWLRGRVPPE